MLTEGTFFFEFSGQFAAGSSDENASSGVTDGNSESDRMFLLTVCTLSISLAS